VLQQFVLKRRKNIFNVTHISLINSTFMDRSSSTHGILEQASSQTVPPSPPPPPSLPPTKDLSSTSGPPILSLQLFIVFFKLYSPTEVYFLVRCELLILKLQFYNLLMATIWFCFSVGLPFRSLASCPMLTCGNFVTFLVHSALNTSHGAQIARSLLR
jgi:hypothetical protein